MWRQGIAASLMMLGLLAQQAFATQRVVIEAEDDYPPYSFSDKGRPAGIYVELVLQAAKRLAPDYEVSIQFVPWKRGLSRLETGESLALIPPYRNAERPFVFPYSVPLLTERVVLFCTPEVMRQRRVDFPRDFIGLRIGINAGYTQSEKLKAAVSAGQVVLEEAARNVNNIRKLSSSRIDCMASDRISAVHTVNRLVRQGDLPAFKLLEAAELSTQEAFIGYSRSFPSAFKNDFVQKMDAALLELQRAGVLDQLVARYTQ
ncbi:MAG: substrate-binding periplasmic protein [Roseateles asaccharophilus]